MRVSIILIGLGLVLGLPTSAMAVDPDTKCYADKVKETAGYYACRLKAESKAIKKGEVPDFSKCDSKYSRKWQKAESKAGGACPTEGDEAAIRSKMVGDADTIVARLSGVRFVDNGDGTIADNQTGSQWEKKTGSVDTPVECEFFPSTCPDLHDVNNEYDWNEANEWLSRVNGLVSSPAESQAGLAGHSDWRIPTVAELETIVDTGPSGCEVSPPCIDSIFGPTVGTSQAPGYWSSTSYAPIPDLAYAVSFHEEAVPMVPFIFKLNPAFVRAVRGGL